MNLRILIVPTVLTLAACTGGAAVDSVESDQALKTGINFDLMHTVPECHHEGKPDTYCTRDDQPALAQASGMEARANAIIDRATDPEKARIIIAYFSFSNTAVFGKLCEKGKAGFRVEGFFDQSYRAQMPAKLATECQGPSGDNVRVHFLGKVSESPFVWRLHHNKFLLVDTGVQSDPIYLNFSSGNLSSFGMAVHFDHWVVMDAPRDTNLVQQHECVLDALRSAIRPEGAEQDQEVDDPAVYRKTLNECLSVKQTLWKPGTDWFETAIGKESIAPLFSPDPSGTNGKLLIAQIDRVASGGKIYGAMQHFLHSGIARALQRATKRGVDVRLVMDAGVVTGTSEVQGVRDFYDSYLQEKVSGMHVHFLLTNAADFQMMHNKFLVMENVDGKKTRVFSGAGHFTEAGLRDNYENFYLSQSDTLSSKYQELFDYMWPRTLTEEAAIAQE